MWHGEGGCFGWALHGGSWVWQEDVAWLRWVCHGAGHGDSGRGLFVVAWHGGGLV